MQASQQELDFTPVGESERDVEQIVRPSTRYWPEVWKRLLHNRVALVCSAILLIIIAFAVIAPMVSPYEYDVTDLMGRNISPNQEHLFGTDSSGRDMWTRVWMGARSSLLIGLLGALAPFVVGTVMGAVSGWCGGWVDMIIMRICDVMLCIPSMIYMILILMVMGGNVKSLVIAMAISGWMGSARSFRGRILQFKNREFTLAARAQGASAARIIFRHILPNILGNLVVGISSAIPAAIFMEAGMAYIGLGVTPPSISLGQLSSESVSFFLIPSKFYLFLYPSLVITLLIFALFMLGNRLRDALDPKLRDEEYNARRLRKLKRRLRTGKEVRP